ncbi:MAG: pilus assembly protein CpaE, partial [Quadrisphaera sp.]
MTSTTTARALRDTGLQWRPAKGDRFVIPDREMDDVVFVVSDMTIEAHDLPSGQVLGFNGTTEWALDSVDAAEVLWLPR